MTGFAGGRRYVQEKWLAQGVSRQELDGWFKRVHGNEEKHEKFLRFEALRPLYDRAPKLPRGLERRIEDIAKLIDSSIVSAQVRLNNAALLPIPTELQAPPQASLDLMLLMADGSVQKATWLLAESWWADAFTAPRFHDLVKWGLLVLPWTVSAHFGARVRRAFKSVRAASGMQQLTRGLWALLHGVEFVVGLVLVLSAIEVRPGSAADPEPDPHLVGRPLRRLHATQARRCRRRQLCRRRPADPDGRHHRADRDAISTGSAHAARRSSSSRIPRAPRSRT